MVRIADSGADRIYRVVVKAGQPIQPIGHRTRDFPAKSQIQSELAGGFPVILQINSMEPGAGYLGNGKTGIAVGWRTQHQGCNRIASASGEVLRIWSGSECLVKIEGGGMEPSTVLIQSDPHISKGQLVRPPNFDKIQRTGAGAARKRALPRSLLRPLAAIA